MKQVLSYLKAFRKEMVFGPLAKTMEAIFELQIPLIMARMIDEGIPTKDVQLVIRYSAIMLGMTVAGYFATMFCQYSAARAQEGFGTKLRTTLFSHIQKLSITQVSDFGSGTLVTRMTSDIYQLQQTLAMFIRIAPRAPLIFVGSTIMVFSIDPQMALIFLVMIPIITGILYFVMSKTLPLYRIVQKKVDAIGILTLENVTGSRVIKAFTKQADQYTQFTQATDDLKDTALQTGEIEAILNPFSAFVVNIAAFGILYFSGIKINIGILTQGEVIALVNYTVQISIALVVLANLTITFSKGYTALVRVGEVFDTVPPTYPTKLIAKTVDPKLANITVLFDNVTFQYEDANLPMLEDISFAVERGKTLGIIGSSGAGKTTLIRLLAGFYDVTAGEIYIDGINVAEYPRVDLRQKLDVVFQTSVLFRGTIAENLRYGNKDATDAELWEALTLAQAADFVQEKPEGLATVIEQSGRNLSGGQRQRIAIARSLVSNPEIIVFDDTSSALDFVTDSKLRKAISTLNKSVITISQRIHSIMDAEQIIVLEHGRIAGIGTHDVLLANNAIYQEIAASQLSEEDQHAK